ncbi:MAG: hypothetical protein EA357_09230 [Micavibrio sp.]|nr:MAG: hypothetical protein EA357_09230 [Micavibrio sp.]
MSERDLTDIPPVPPHLFSILESTRAAFLFIAEEWRYLMRLAIPVLIVQLGTALIYHLFKTWRETERSGFEAFLWELPGNVLLGWFICCLARLIIFGERLGNLPVRDLRFMQYRADLIRASIFLTLLLQAAVVLLAEISAAFTPSGPEQEDVSGIMLILGLAITVFIFWSIRLLVTPLLAAVDYPISLFLKQARGFMFSLRLLGVIALCTIPVFFVFQLFAALTMSPVETMSKTQMLVLVLLTKPVGIIISALMNAGFIFALKEMLGQSKKI